MSVFTLHPRLQADTLFVGDLPLCTVRLMNHRAYPWLILIPRREGVSELHQLNEPDQHQLLVESAQVSKVLEELFQPDKLNVAALGNVVPQFHWHIVARFKGDAAWPGPVWGHEEYSKYAADEKEALILQLQCALFPSKG
ncbi:MAG: HIT domain-containing protein [Mariprofundaceae bacterium]